MSTNTRLEGVARGATTADEAALLAAFRGLKDAHRGHLLGMARILAETNPRPRPALTIVRNMPREDMQ